MHHARMQMTKTRAPQALPALLVGTLAVAWALVLGGLLAALLGVGAAMMGAMAYADTRSHGYSGEGMAIAGAVLGVLGILLYFVGLALL
jgi:hypothetical protein